MRFSWLACLGRPPHPETEPPASAPRSITGRSVTAERISLASQERSVAFFATSEFQVGHPPTPPSGLHDDHDNSVIVDAPLSSEERSVSLFAASECQTTQAPEPNSDPDDDHDDRILVSFRRSISDIGVVRARNINSVASRSTSLRRSRIQNSPLPRFTFTIKESHGASASRFIDNRGRRVSRIQFASSDRPPRSVLPRPSIRPVRASGVDFSGALRRSVSSPVCDGRPSLYDMLDSSSSTCSTPEPLDLPKLDRRDPDPHDLDRSHISTVKIPTYTFAVTHTGPIERTRFCGGPARGAHQHASLQKLELAAQPVPVPAYSRCLKKGALMTTLVAVWNSTDHTASFAAFDVHLLLCAVRDNALFVLGTETRTSPFANALRNCKTQRGIPQRCAQFIANAGAARNENYHTHLLRVGASGTKQPSAPKNDNTATFGAVL
eukprot:IDg23725t1